ncbi:hypothetical protein K402DRAFT_396316 [Aulographum hederae CBS 113979]|uniref:Uncharacterized protein n=1 Tax=Aulographum hederae CBS 113979 TaxID=1176131 RepID=A0A6G1GSE1_9PEZI|nr:hypothetical protein K402DRAFT_396316 [Aulographum hederae CBS 113979]
MPLSPLQPRTINEIAGSLNTPQARANTKDDTTGDVYYPTLTTIEPASSPSLRAKEHNSPSAPTATFNLALISPTVASIASVSSPIPDSTKQSILQPPECKSPITPNRIPARKSSTKHKYLLPPVQTIASPKLPQIVSQQHMRPSPTRKDSGVAFNIVNPDAASEGSWSGDEEFFHPALQARERSARKKKGRRAARKSKLGGDEELGGENQGDYEEDDYEMDEAGDMGMEGMTLFPRPGDRIEDERISKWLAGVSLLPPSASGLSSTSGDTLDMDLQNDCPTSDHDDPTITTTLTFPTLKLPESTFHPRLHGTDDADTAAAAEIGGEETVAFKTLAELDEKTCGSPRKPLFIGDPQIDDLRLQLKYARMMEGCGRREGKEAGKEERKEKEVGKAEGMRKIASRLRRAVIKEREEAEMEEKEPNHENDDGKEEEEDNSDTSSISNTHTLRPKPNPNPTIALTSNLANLSIASTSADPNSSSKPHPTTTPSTTRKRSHELMMAMHSPHLSPCAYPPRLQALFPFPVTSTTTSNLASMSQEVDVEMKTPPSRPLLDCGSGGGSGSGGHGGMGLISPLDLSFGHSHSFQTEKQNQTSRFSGDFLTSTPPGPDPSSSPLPLPLSPNVNLVRGSAGGARKRRKNFKGEDTADTVVGMEREREREGMSSPLTMRRMMVLGMGGEGSPSPSPMKGCGGVFGR